MCNDVRETSTKVLNNLLSITSIHYPLNYNTQRESIIINANFKLVKFFTNIAICTNLVGQLKTGGKDLREGTIIESTVERLNKNLILQVKSMKVKANMLDMMVFVYEKASPFPERKFTMRLNSINSSQTYAVFITQYIKRSNVREYEILGQQKKFVLRKLASIIEKINNKSDKVLYC